MLGGVAGQREETAGVRGERGAARGTWKARFPTAQAAATTAGNSVATVPVLLMKADRQAVSAMTTTSSRNLEPCAISRSRLPPQAVTPVCDSPSPTTNSAAIITTVGLPNPAHRVTCADHAEQRERQEREQCDEIRRPPPPNEQHDRDAQDDEGRDQWTGPLSGLCPTASMLRAGPWPTVPTVLTRAKRHYPNCDSVVVAARIAAPRRPCDPLAAQLSERCRRLQSPENLGDTVHA